MAQPTRAFLQAVLPPPMREALEQLERRTSVRAPTGLRFTFADQLAGLNPVAWDEVTRGAGLLLSRAYLGALEAARLPNFEHRFCLAFDGERPVLALAMQLVEVAVDRLHPADEPVIAGVDTSELEQTLRQRVLVCGNMLSSGCDGIAVAEGVDPALAFRAVGEALYRVRRAEKLNGHPNLVMVKDFTVETVDPTQVPGLTAASAVLESLSYRRMAGGATMVLSLDPSWKTHADYLSGMVSKYRSAVKRRIVAPVSEGGCEVVTLSAAEVEQHAGRLQELHLAVQDNAKVRPVTVSERYWSEVARVPGCVFKAIVRRGEVLGFLLVQVDGESAHAAQIGFDRAVAEELPLYLRLLHTAVEVGLEHRCRTVVLGRTALEPKARMGAKPVDTFMWVRHRVPVVNALTKGLVELVKHDAAPQIDPFKRALDDAAS